VPGPLLGKGHTRLKETIFVFVDPVDMVVQQIMERLKMERELKFRPGAAEGTIRPGTLAPSCLCQN
jgi:hypothetical protein